MEFQIIAEKIIKLKDADLELRNQLIRSGNLGNRYNKEMADLHNRNAKKLNKIIKLIGYPTKAKVGEQASDAAWLIIQHSIGQPEFMRKCAYLLEQAVSEKRANPKHLAFLKDRIASYEGKPQIYGSSFDWDEQGEMSPKPYDDLTKVNQRRKSLGLNTIQEQTQIMREQVKRENQLPPEDLKKRKEEYDKWRKSVGWIK